MLSETSHRSARSTSISARRPKRPHLCWVGALWLALVGWSAVGTQAQVIANPNQITGTYQFTNTDPAVLTVLNSNDINGASRGLIDAQVDAVSLGQNPALQHEVLSPSNSTVDGVFDLTVEAGPAGFGIAYEVQVTGRLNSGLHRYLFAPQTTAPVEEEPAHDATLTMAECVGLLDVQWVDISGQPITVRVLGVDASRGDGTLQAHTSYLGNRQQTYLAVRGDGHTYSFEADYETGSSIFVDSLRHRFETPVTVGCDDIVPVVITVPDGPSGLGRIIGNVDVLGEPERLFNQSTLVGAAGGPLLNQRRDHLDAAPYSGAFDLANLLPSDAESPPNPYEVAAFMTLRSGRDLVHYNTEQVSVTVGAGQTVDMGNTLVIDPGYIGGDLLFAGPASQAGSPSCVADVYRFSDDDSDGDGLPDNTRRNSASLLRTFSGNNSIAWSDFGGDFDSTQDAFVGDYELVVGRVGGIASNWDTRSLNLRWLDEDTSLPSRFQDSWLSIRDSVHTHPPSNVGPGQTAVVDRAYCFSQVNLSFHALNGQFFDPTVLGGSSGSFDGVDFQGRTLNYNVAVGSQYVEPTLGTPQGASQAAGEGLVALCLPQGDYTFRPAVHSVGSDGSVSLTELPPVDVSVGCRQIIDVDPELQLALDSLPLCAASPNVSLAGQADSDVAVTQIEASLNGGTPDVLCTDCGVDPAFAYGATLAQCSNTLQVSAVDAVGNSAAVSVTTHLDTEAPMVSGCADVDVEVEEGAGGAFLDLGFVQADDVCQGALTPQCNGPADGFFPIGVTTVQCSATDLCGNSASCAFDVTVMEESPGHTDCVDDAFDGPTLDGAWTVHAMGDATQVDAQVVNGKLQVSGTGTTFYHGDDHGAFVYQSIDGDFFAEVDITGVPLDQGGTYRKGSFTVRKSLAVDAPRVTIQFIPHYPTPDVPALQFDVRGNDGIARTLASTVQGIALPVRVAIEKRGGHLTIYYSNDDGATWIHPLGGLGGEVDIDFGGQPALVGVSATSYDANQAVTFEYDDFEVCQPDDGPPSDPSTVPCNDDPPRDVVYLMDLSGSMDRDFDGAVTKAEAARQVVLRLNRSLELRGDGSRAALVTFAGNLFASDPAQLSAVETSFQSDMTLVDAAAESIDLNAIDASDTTPSSHGLGRVRQLFLDDGSNSHRKVVIWITDSLPNIDDAMGGPGAYTETEISALTLYDGSGGFLSPGTVAWSGTFNGALGTFDGEVLADAMLAAEDLQALDPALRIYGVVPRGDGVQSPVLPEDLLDYAAFLTQGQVVGATDLGALLDQMPGLLQDLSCGANGTAALGGLIWQDTDGDGAVNPSESLLSGVTVRILDDMGLELATATTGGDGRYQFVDAEPGTYTLEVDTATLPSGVTDVTYDLDGVATPHTITLTVVGYDVVDVADFGYRTAP